MVLERYPQTSCLLSLFLKSQTSLTPIRLSPAVRGSVRVYTTEYSAPVLGGGLSLDLLLLAERLGALQRGGVLFQHDTPLSPGS